MKILILSNHYLTLRVFRRELIQEMSKDNEVVISLPEDEKEYMDELRSFGARLVFLKNMDRRAINPIEDLKLIREYKKLLLLTTIIAASRELHIQSNVMFTVRMPVKSLIYPAIAISRDLALPFITADWLSS